MPVHRQVQYLESLCIEKITDLLSIIIEKSSLKLKNDAEPNDSKESKENINPDVPNNENVPNAEKETEIEKKEKDPIDPSKLESK